MNWRARVLTLPVYRLSLKAARAASTWILWRLPTVTPWTVEFQRIASFEPVAVRFLAFCICLSMNLCSPRPTMKMPPPQVCSHVPRAVDRTDPCARPTSRVACGEKRRDHPPSHLTSSYTAASEGLPNSALLFFFAFQWPECYQPKPQRRPSCVPPMCLQLHSTVRGVTHVIVERGRKPQAERLPSGPSFFFC